MTTGSLDIPFFIHLDDCVATMIIDNELIGFHEAVPMSQHFIRPIFRILYDLIVNYKKTLLKSISKQILDMIRKTWKNFVELGGNQTNPYIDLDVETEIIGEDCPTCGTYMGMGFSLDTSNPEKVKFINLNIEYRLNEKFLEQEPEMPPVDAFYILAYLLSLRFLVHHYQPPTEPQKTFLDVFAVDIEETERRFNEANQNNIAKSEFYDAHDYLSYAHRIFVIKWYKEIVKKLKDNTITPEKLTSLGYVKWFYWLNDYTKISNYIESILGKLLNPKTDTVELVMYLNIFVEYYSNKNLENNNPIFRFLVDNRDKLNEVAKSLYVPFPYKTKSRFDSGQGNIFLI
ncbi:MAG: hypothetical protein GPJ54_06635 [Candidatus Heimdallarchaeota archaeon]|nr:hypothetical protein [Candidatus Heimdallarchaeota archaeon]